MNSVYIVAELSANHNQDINIAKESIKAACDIGADAVKLQTYTPDTITIDCDNEYFQINQGTIWDGTTLYQLYGEAQTPWEWHEELFAYARSLNIGCFSSPFDPTAVDFLEKLDVDRYKIASFEITDTPLIEYAAAKGKPMIISTGIAGLADIEHAVTACRSVGNNQITLLKCTSAYPASLEEANILTMVNLRETFGVEVGLSDHSVGEEASIVAVALGATLLEKHFILDRSIGGPDASFSLEPNEFESLVGKVRNAQLALGNVTYEMTEKIQKRREFSRSLFVVEDIPEGGEITDKNVRSIRPGYGLSPALLKSLLGTRVARNVKRGTPLSYDLFMKPKD